MTCLTNRQKNLPYFGFTLFKTNETFINSRFGESSHYLIAFQIEPVWYSLQQRHNLVQNILVCDILWSKCHI